MGKEDKLENEEPVEESSAGNDEDIGMDDEEAECDLALVEQMGVCSVDADYVEMYQSGSVMTRAETAVMNESGSLILVADDVEMSNSWSILMIAADVEGEPKTVFTPLTAAIFGGTLGLTLFMLGQLFRGRRG